MYTYFIEMGYRKDMLQHQYLYLNLAIFSSNFEVNRLVFTGSNFLPATHDRGSKRVLLNPLVGRILTFLKPVIKKRTRGGRPTDTINVYHHQTGFFLKDFPLNAIREMWKLQVQ